MAKHMIQLYLGVDEGVDLYFDWDEFFGSGISVLSEERQEIKGDLEHVAVVYITRPLSIEEWVEFGDKQDEAIYSVIGEGNALVMAGPLPEVEA